ncbi:SLC13 family permease [Catenovulum sp. SM1970]|uniref:SLC13 family permease n=1 Tax=Marinifaba aquimaris TaxID=2741323 RepID=UPI0015730502|nr:SLC13 family permease [Marinifaba aquimaris]NTS78518.1 SLC13 family permease [Marinifaba aquimaris]
MLSQWIVAAIFAVTIIALISSRWRATRVFTFTLVSLFITGIITPEQSLQNAVSPGVATLIALLLASRALERTSVLKLFASKAIDDSEAKTVAKLSGLAAFFSSFLNNTAVVATLIKPIKAQSKHPSSRLLIPLSYAAILGGTTTLIGTSTNMVVNSFWMNQGNESLGFFSFLPIGLALVICGAFLLILRRQKLPLVETKTDDSHYFIDLKINPNSPLVGKTIEESSLRNLNSFYLVELVRASNSITPVQPNRVLQAKDRLVFCGDVNHIEELQRVEGATIFAEHTGLMSDNLVEVVVAERSTLVGQTLKSAGFRAMFDAAVVGLKRNGLRVPGKLGEVKLKEGDSLLLAAGGDFKKRKNLSKHFFVISDLSVDQPLTVTQNACVLAGFATVLAASIAGLTTLFTGLCIFIVACMAAGLLKSAELKRLFPFDLWLIITAALTLADAMMQSGLSDTIATSLHAYFSQQSALFAMIGVIIVTMILTEIVTNTAAAALMFPLALGFAHSFGVSEMTFVMAVAFGASACFLSPYGYQTNLLVFNTGGYKFTDFTKFGLPFSLMYLVVCSLLIPYFFPF